jgi:hypothetical protein
MTFLYMAHSGVRYLVLLSGLVALVVLLRGLVTGAAYGKPARISAASYAGLLSLQGILGIAMVIMGRWYGALMGHMAMMVLAIAAAQTLTGWGKRSPDAKRAHMLSLAGVVVSLLLIVGGIMAIGRHPLQSNAFQAVVAAE